MSARDELMGKLANTICNVSLYPGRAQPYLLGGDMNNVLAGTADAILAAGYRKSRTITTVAELDALEDGVLVLTEQGGYWESVKRLDGLNWWHEPDSTDVSPSEDLTLPATVLYEPTA